MNVPTSTGPRSSTTSNAAHYSALRNPAAAPESTIGNVSEDMLVQACSPSLKWPSSCSNSCTWQD
jgi:hypothetical protein